MGDNGRYEKLLRISEVLAIVGVGRSTISHLVQTDDFPRPVQVGERAVRGRLSETCACGGYSTIEFPPDAPPRRNIWPESAHHGIAGFTRQEALTDAEERRYRAILGL